MKKFVLIFSFLLVGLFIIPTSLFARIGVGVATGKIVVHDKLKPGIIYNLPPLTVVNTGDVPSDYGVEITYFEKQSQLKPPNEWFIFSPAKFHLDPGKVQVVQIKLNLPVAVTPGDYFGFLEAHPVQKDTVGQTTVGIAAATKLYFTILPANIFQAIYYKLTSFWVLYEPWTNWGAGFVVIIILIFLFKRFFHLEINVKQKKTPESHNG